LGAPTVINMTVGAPTTRWVGPLYDSKKQKEEIKKKKEKREKEKKVKNKKVHLGITKIPLSGFWFIQNRKRKYNYVYIHIYVYILIYIY
jgi:hypothetical protein